MELKQFDVSVIGGGMVGAAIAVALSQSGLQVALIERQAPLAFNRDSAPDLRVSSINLASETWLSQLGAWASLEQMRLCPYQRLQAFEQPHSIVTFNAADIKRSHLGHIVENNLLHLALLPQFGAHVTSFFHTTVPTVCQR